jgi:hypothetical protein
MDQKDRMPGYATREATPIGVDMSLREIKGTEHMGFRLVVRLTHGAP